MGNIILASNRLPITVERETDKLNYKKSIGGLATGLASVHKQSNSIWVGWPGISENSINNNEKTLIRNELKSKYKCLPVYLSDEDLDKYYYGFCNKTIWPLFHYFQDKVEYNYDTWNAYKKVNTMFFNEIDQIIGDNDIVWIHDYQLMLLPQMIKKKHPNIRIGFFLHIPFPSFEIFRMLIWREEILEGLMGADLIGFHTYNYVHHFLSCVNKLLGAEYNSNEINYEGRIIQVDAIPMGIDYDYFSKEHSSEKSPKEVKTKEIVSDKNNCKMILSVDRLDYTKGIPERIKAYDRFLSLYPEYRAKVRLNLIVAPSRSKIDSYDSLRKKITQSVSEVNGKYGTFDWMPIWYYYHSFSQEDLILIYRHSDVLLVTPIRDGMNLVSKEYIASRTDLGGMVVISETAGASSELVQAVVVNANDCNAIAAGIKTAIEMPENEKILRNKIMHEHIKRFNVEFWVNDFLNKLKNVPQDNDSAFGRNDGNKDIDIICNAYKKAKKRLILLDYDGALVGFHSIPENVKPDDELKKLLSDLSSNPNNIVVIASRRDRKILDGWLGNLNLNFIASDGLWLRRHNSKWLMTLPQTTIDTNWKNPIRSILDLYTYNMPGSFIEEKIFSLVWHYRRCDQRTLSVKYPKIKEALICLMAQFKNLELHEGSKVLEIKDKRLNKGTAASIFIQNFNFDFILGIGDDYTDEAFFTVLPKEAFSVKVGPGNTHAKYHVNSWKPIRFLISRFNNSAD